MEINEKDLEFVLSHYKEGSLNTDKAIRRVKSRVGISLIPWRMISSIAAAVIVVVGLFVWNNQKSYTVLSSNADKSEFTLPDSSIVTLSKGSTLKFKPQAMIEGKSRQVKLFGKAFFEVERNEAKPFEITSKNGFVRVLGTKFQVDADSQEVYVESGKVLFSKSSKLDGVILTKGMKAVLYADSDIPTIIEEASVNEIAWKRGTFGYIDQPVLSVIEELKTYYGKNIVIKTKRKDIDDLRLTGEFDVNSPKDVLDAISLAFDIEVDFK